MNIKYEKLTPYPNKDNKLTFLTGTKTLEPVKYYIRSRKIPYWWIFTTTEYYIETEFCTLNGLKSTEECMEKLTRMGIGIRDISLDV